MLNSFKLYKWVFEFKPKNKTKTYYKMYQVIIEIFEFLRLTWTLIDVLVKRTSAAAGDKKVNNPCTNAKGTRTLAR